MNGGIYQQKGRSTWRIWFPWKGRKIYINKYLDGTPLYHPVQAQRVLEKLRSEVDQGIFDPANWGKDRSLLIENAWRQYQEQAVVGPDRMTARENIFQNYILPHFKGLTLKMIEENHINAWWSFVLAGNFAPAYNRVIRATLRAFLSFHRVTRIKALSFPVAKVPHKTVEWLTAPEQARVLEFIPPQHSGIIEFIIVYGCRPSEACNLKKSDIDWDHKRLTFKQRKAGDENVLPLTPRIETILRTPRHIESLEFAFSKPSGGQYSRQELWKVWSVANRSANKKYGLKVVSLKNATRHSKASQLMTAGEPISLIARILGNSEKVVEQSYGRVGLDRLSEVL